MIENNNVVSIKYEVIDALTKELIDKSKDNQPLEFITGCSQVIEGLEQQIQKASIGDSLSFSVSPEQGYGIRNPELMQEVDRSHFSHIELEKGMTVFGESENGMPVQVIVADFNDTSVLIDYNHPLAGKTLDFKVEVLDAREATPDELVAGLRGGCGSGCGCGSNKDSNHESGGCCGGHGGGGCGCGH
ncbi:peptidylprolyl isomerase [Helicobacter didelphidarum]|uniref:Peptidyl-prolyl cis-trans isomerase n=1 Tax=Helicobacter didelphidarum TaxID=2040648 RepID=A0A3D8INX8_9HELI|nr:peptidylprolyl isomerase [Helicobacter didelphidarum]RDU66700.1 peptidylprolyl isomerase [Helicobacter didelphidarum]